MKWILSIVIFIATALSVLFLDNVSLWVMGENFTAWLNEVITEPWLWIFIIAVYGILIYLFFGIGIIPIKYCDQGVRYKHCISLYTEINQMNICLIFVCTMLLTVFYDFSNNAYFFSIAFTRGIIATLGATLIYLIVLSMSLRTILCTIIAMMINIFMGITIWQIWMSWGAFGYIVAVFGGVMLLAMIAALFFKNHGDREESKPYLIAIPYLVLGGIGLHYFGIIGCATGCFVGALLGAVLYLANYYHSIPHCPRCGDELMTTWTSYSNDVLYTHKECYNCGYDIVERG